MALPGLMTREFALPAVTDKLKNKNEWDGYSVKYYKADLDDLEDISMLQEIETRGLAGDQIVILSFDKFTFMSNYYVIVRYMEKNPE
jgi:hypothetical protein